MVNFINIFSVTLCVLGITLTSGCAVAPAPSAPAAAPWAKEFQSDPISLLNRLTWGSNTNEMRQLSEHGIAHYLDSQLSPTPWGKLPDTVQSQLASMQISQKTMEQLVVETEQQRKAADSVKNDDDKKTA